MKRLTGTALFLLTTIICLSCVGQQYVGGVQLPDLLTLKDGRKVTTIRQWEKERKPALIKMLKKEMYGQDPGKQESIRFKVFDMDTMALGGKAIRKQITILFDGRPAGPQMDMLLYIPKNQPGRVPAIIGLNFNGNQSVSTDSGIRIDTNWMGNGKGVVNNRATSASRGISAAQWPIELILEKGYAVATIYRGAIDPDFDDSFKNGVHAMYPRLQHRDDNFATVAAWAWGLSRGLDYLETDGLIDSKKITVFGFSRLGKAALWAGAIDERFSLVISNESGAGGAKLFQLHSGEDIRRLNDRFPHWFNKNFRKYIDKDTVLPFDQHMVIALIAPRPIYVASAIEDTNSNPEAEFYGIKAAEPVYRLYGWQGLPATSFPKINMPVEGQQLAYHVRSGKHDVTVYDWQQFLGFMDKHFKN